MPDFKLYRSDDSLLIRGIGEHEIDLPIEDALRLADAIRATLAPQRVVRRTGKKSHYWSAEEKGELLRLAAGEMSWQAIGDHFGVSKQAAHAMARTLGAEVRFPERAASLREAWARRKAA